MRALNREKCEFFGFIFSAQGVLADPKKVAAVRHGTDPQTGQVLLQIPEECVDLIASHATPKAMTFMEIKAQTLKDPPIRHNTWHKTDKSWHTDILKKFRQVSSQLTT